MSPMLPRDEPAGLSRLGVDAGDDMQGEAEYPASVFPQYCDVPGRSEGLTQDPVTPKPRGRYRLTARRARSAATTRVPHSTSGSCDLFSSRRMCNARAWYSKKS